MRRTGYKSSPAFAIILDHAQPVYFPGDTLKGYVISNVLLNQESSLSTVQLTLSGRAKTKSIVKRNGHPSVDRGRAVYFQQPQILRGDGHGRWTFSVTIPNASTLGFASRGNKFKPEMDYLATIDPKSKQEIDVTEHPLPSVMYYHKKSTLLGRTVEAFIEYGLLAKSGNMTASLPLTPRLLPEHAEKPITIGQKLKIAARSSDIPRYTCFTNVVCPTVIQLDHPDPIPLKIYVVPNLDTRRTTIYSGGDLRCLPPIEVVSMKIDLKSKLKIRCEGGLEKPMAQYHTFGFPFPGEFSPVAVPVILVAEPRPPVNAYLSSGSPPANSPKVATKDQYEWAASQTVDTVASPSGALDLEWSIVLSCAGQTHTICGGNPVTVLAPSEEQECRKRRQLGTEGMKKNNDDMMSGVDMTAQITVQVLGSVLENLLGV
ncbi:hypothetical protein MMC17_007674 [Xylographa soralifera]|nr:hypothetical protein [Xylographa soralifera]